MEVNNLQTDGSADLESNGKNAAGRWTSEEHSLFILGLQIHNKQWKNIADMVKTRTVVQIRTHAQKYFQKLEKTNPSGSAAFNNKAMTDGGVFPESNSCDPDDSRMANYRAQSICSTDSADSSKYGRSVSLGSDAGTESDYLDRTAGGLASGAVPHCSSFPTDMLINSYMTSGLVDLKPRSSTMTDLQQQQQQPKASSAPKKRSRDSAKVNGGIGTAQTPKSPKRNHHKQMAQQHQQQHHHHTHGPYGIPHSASECDELDMISLLEKIDWNAIPSPHRSHASSPFTDTAASLSSSSGHVSYKNVLSKCQQASSPLQFSHIDQVNVNEELTDNDVFDVFDEYYKNIDTTAAPVPTLKLPLEIKKEAKPAASATAAAPANPALMDAKLQPRVWFSSSVIGELKTNFSIGNGILKPWKDRKPVTKLPPLHSLTSSTPPVVIASQSLTPLDSTFCNYPPQLYQTDETADGFKGYASDATATTSGGSSSSSSSSGFSIKVPESPSGYDSLSSPKTYASYDSVTRRQVVVPLADFTAPPAQSPVVKKRGRPRKSSLTNGSAAASASSVAVKSRSCNNLSAAAQPGFPMSSYPSFPNIGTTGSYPAPNVRESRSRKNSVSAAAAAAAAAPIAPPLSGPMHHFDDFLMGNDGDMASSFAHQLSHEHDAAFASLNQTAPHALYANPFHGDDAAEDVQMQLDCSLSFGFDEHELQAEAAGNAAAAAAAAAASGAVGADSSMAVVKQEEDLFDVFDAVFE